MPSARFRKACGVLCSAGSVQGVEMTRWAGVVCTAVVPRTLAMFSRLSTSRVRAQRDALKGAHVRSLIGRFSAEILKAKLNSLNEVLPQHF